MTNRRWPDGVRTTAAAQGSEWRPNNEHDKQWPQNGGLEAVDEVVAAEQAVNRK